MSHRRKFVSVRLADLVKASPKRPPGYYQDVLAAGERRGSRVYFPVAVYAALAEKYSTGPGKELKLLLEAFGIRPTQNCKCNKMAAQMNRWGPDECLNHLDEIVDVMEEEAKKRSLPFLRAAGRVLVRKAIANARKKSRDIG